jgi:hypothetical protein
MEKKILLAEQLPQPVEQVARRIYVIRGQRVMLDSDLAELYQVETKALNQAVHRNPARFPEDFMFQLTVEEATSLRSQFVTSNEGRGGRRYLPYAFTELVVAMLSSVLKSERAVQMNIVIMRAFVKMRELLLTNKALSRRIEQLTATVKDHAALFEIVIGDIQNLDKKFSTEIARLKNPRRRKPSIGFITPRN